MKWIVCGSRLQLLHYQWGFFWLVFKPDTRFISKPTSKMKHSNWLVWICKCKQDLRILENIIGFKIRRFRNDIYARIHIYLNREKILITHKLKSFWSTPMCYVWFSWRPDTHIMFSFVTLFFNKKITKGKHICSLPYERSSFMFSKFVFRLVSR